MNDKEKLISELIKEKGGTREDYLSVLNKIAFHESAGTMDPTIKQYGGGPGRGKYQFEEGRNEGAITAARRTKRYYQSKGFEVPEWLKNATAGNSLDASTLTSEQQDALFLGNMRMHPKADLGKVVNGQESVEEFWANYHWAGSKEDRAERIESFRDSTQRYAQAKPEVREGFKPQFGKKNVADERQEAIAVQDNIPKPQEIHQPKQWLPFQNQAPQQEQAIADGNQYAEKPLLDTSIYKGVMDYVSTKNKFNEYNSGGRHEENPLGGVPIGVGANGLPNTVEEGETSYTFGDDKFVFSDRIKTNDKRLGNNFDQPIIDNSFADGGLTNPPTDKEVINEMKNAKDYIYNYHNSPKFKERFTNAQIDYSRHGENGIRELKQKNELNNYVQGRTALEFIDEYKYQPALKNINSNLNEGGHYLLQGKNGQPLTDAFKRIMKGRPNPKANGTGSHYDPGRNIVFQYKNQLQEEGGDHGAIAAHEFSHNAVSRWGNEAETIPEEQRKYIQSLQRNVQGDHDLDVYETKGDIDALRYLLNEEKLYDAGKEDFTQDHLNKAFKNNRIKDEFTFNRLLRLYGKDNIIELMNTVADNGNNKNAVNVAAYGGFQTKSTDPTDPRLKTVKAQDNTRVAMNKIGMKAQSQEEKAAAADLLQLKTTGTINQPKSVRYKQIPQTPTMVSQDTRSESQHRKDVQIASEIKDATLSPLERPLVYLANPLKAVGDAVSTLNPNRNPFPTSTEDAREIAHNKYYGDQSAFEKGLGYVPEAALNVATEGAISAKLGRKSLGKYFSKLKSKFDAPANETAFNITKNTIAVENRKRILRDPQDYDELDTFMKHAHRKMGNVGNVIESKIRKDMQAKYPGQNIDEPFHPSYFDAMGLRRQYKEQANEKLDKTISPRIKKYLDLQKDYFNDPKTRKKLEDIGIEPDGFIKNIDDISVNTRYDSRDGSSYDSGADVLTFNINDTYDPYGGNPYSNWRSVIDHEIGHTMQTSRGRQLTAKLKNEGKYADYRFANIYPTKLDETAGLLKSDYPAIPEDKLADYYREGGFKKMTDLASDPTWSYSYFDNAGRDLRTYGALSKVERLAHLREMKSEMQNAGIIKDFNNDITVDMIKEYKKKSPKNRILQFATDDEKNFNFLKDLLNKTPIITGAVAGGAALKNKK